MKTYEYKVIEHEFGGIFKGKRNLAELEKQLQELGAEGWEVIAQLPHIGCSHSTHSLITTLKKEISS